MAEEMSKSEIKSAVADAKSRAYKLKSVEDVKKFMDANKSKIADVSKKLKGDAKKSFDKIVDVVDSYCSSVEESSDTKLKVICGLVAVIMWLIGMGGAWIIAAASPIIGPLLVDVLKKVPGLNESGSIEESALVATPFASALVFNKLPPFAQKILNLDGGFEMYDVAYDDEEQCNHLQQRANALGVVVNGNKGLKVDADFESCSGKVGACIKYLRDYLDADHGYIGGGTLYFDDPNAVTDEEFTDFCQWMNQWLPDWTNGVEQNRLLYKKMHIVDVK